MKASLSLLSIIVATVGTSSAQAVTSTLTVTPAACPTAAPADVVVTRSAVVVPSCAAGNGTKASIVSMGGNSSGAATATGTGSVAQFTGAAGHTSGFGMGVLGAVALALML